MILDNAEEQEMRKNSVVFVGLLILLLSVLGCGKKEEYPRTFDLLKFRCMDGQMPDKHFSSKYGLCNRPHDQIPEAEPGYLAHFFGRHYGENNPTGMGNPDGSCYVCYADIEYIPDQNEMIIRLQIGWCESEWSKKVRWMRVFEEGTHFVFWEWETMGTEPSRAWFFAPSMHLRRLSMEEAETKLHEFWHSMTWERKETFPTYRDN